MAYVSDVRIPANPASRIRATTIVGQVVPGDRADASKEARRDNQPRSFASVGGPGISPNAMWDMAYVGLIMATRPLAGSAGWLALSCDAA